MITRRNFFGMLGLTSVAGLSLDSVGSAFGQALRTDEAFATPRASMSNPVLSFTSAHFTPFIDTDFEVRQENLRLRLLNVKDSACKENLARNIQGDSFSLMFTSLAGAELKENEFEFSHPALGAFSLHLVPVSAEPNRYEAIINHHRRA